MVARPDPGDGPPDDLDDAGTLVAHHHGLGTRRYPLKQLEVAVAQARSHDPHDDLVQTGLAPVEVVSESGPALVDDNSPHVFPVNAAPSGLDPAP